MRNYNTLEEILKDNCTNFIKNISNNLGKVDTHFLSDVFCGILKYNSVNLSDFVRQSGKTNIKKGVERLERHLDDFESIRDTIKTNYENMVKSYINNRKLYFVDRSDIVKDQYTKFENKGTVLDGSNEHKLAYGYQINEIATLDNANQPFSLVSELRSTKDEDYKSDNDLWLKHMQYVSKTYGSGTFICDRGYDSAILMEKIIENKDNFIIRAKSLNRIVYINGEKTSINNLVLKHKGYYKFNSKYGHLKVTYKNIKIKSADAKSLENHLLTLVIVKGFGAETDPNKGNMVLLTSRKVCSKNEVLQVVQDYILRWKIEESFKYKKQQFKLEKIMVRRYKRIQALNTLLSYFMFFSNIINLEAVGKTIRKAKLHLKNLVLFWLYRISDGIKKFITFFSNNLMGKLYPPRKHRVWNLFTACGIEF